MPSTDSQITWEFLLAAYMQGYFPMAASRESKTLEWFYPEFRGILPLDSFHVPKSLAKFMRKSHFTITTNQAFEQVIKNCANISKDRESTWINDEIIKLYCQLHANGFAHSVECWQKSDDKALLAGGLYGVAIGGAFFGESMFSRASNASKVALVHLVELLRKSGYTLLDAQFTNEHLLQFGTQEITRADYLAKLENALAVKPEKCF
jgi:leucyl/phenylalanyl-tRNA--protein transferase